MCAVSATAYRGLFAEPALRRLAIADACARLPQGMVSLTLLLVAAEHASMAVAGLVVAGYTPGQAMTGPVRGRLADRYGARTLGGHAPGPFGRNESSGGGQP